MYKIDDTVASLIIDDFTKEVTIQLTKVAGDTYHLFVDTFELDIRERYIDDLKKMGIQFAFQCDKFYLRLKGRVTENDTIHFLFEDGTVIEKRINKKHLVARAEFAEVIELSIDEIKIFATVFLNKWKLTIYATNSFIIGGFIENQYFNQYMTSSDGQYLLLKTARQLIEQVVIYLPKPEFKDLIE